MSPIPNRKVRLGPRDTRLTRRPDASLLLRSPHPLEPYPKTLISRLEHWAALHPERTLIASRERSGGWRAISYREALRAVRGIGQALLDRKPSPERPIAILSGSSIEHLLLVLAALHVGVPHAPISPAYSLVASDFGKLRRMLDLLTPSVVFADHGQRFAAALRAAAPQDAELVVVEEPPHDRAATPFERLVATTPTDAVERAHGSISPDQAAKILFTSGSTGLPKGVINTHRMLCASQQMFAQALPVIADTPPVLLDWLPWHHASGGNLIIGLTVYNGGTLYLDDGRPVPGLIEQTVANLLEVAPTAYFTVPKAYEDLQPFLRADRALRENFFSRLSFMYYSGAALAAHVRDGMERISLETCGEHVPIISGYGQTETGAFSLCANWIDRAASPVGLPVPGVELKLVPDAGKLEARIRAPNTTPGYWRQPKLTEALYDDEGFLKTGDALRFIDPEQPVRGLAFDGRLGEDFKLSTGTWVSVGALRTRIIEAGKPLIQDVVIAGAGCAELTILIFPVMERCRELCSGVASGASDAEVLSHAAVVGRFREVLEDLARSGTGSSNRITRAIVLDEPPHAGEGEITDKGSINQRAVLARRAALVDELYSEKPGERVLQASRTWP